MHPRFPSPSHEIDFEPRDCQLCTFRFDDAVSIADTEPIRVACLGDSITAGARVDAAYQPFMFSSFLLTGAVVKAANRRSAPSERLLATIL